MIRTTALSLAVCLLGAAPPAAPTPIQTPATFTITFTSIPPDGVLYEWDFDYRGSFAPDYTDVLAGEVSYTYPAVGSYTARLVVTDDLGGQATYDVATAVAPLAGPPHVVLFSPGIVPPDQIRAFRVEAIPALGASIALYEWDIDGDGTVDQSGPALSSVDFPARPIGVYPFRVVVTDSRGAATTIASTCTVDNETAASQAPPPTSAKPSFGPPPDLPEIEAFTATAGGGPPTDLMNGPLSARVGDLVTFDATANSGKSGLGTMKFFRFDFDGRNGATQFDLTRPGTTTPESMSATHHYDAPGTYTVTLRVQDTEDLISTRTATVNVSVEPGAFKTWIFQPRNGQHVFGDAVTIRAKTFPTGQTKSVTFKYRAVSGGAPPPPSDPSWTTIKTVTPPPFTFLSTTWDVTGLPPGDYDLAAVATRALGDSFSNERIVVTVDPAAPEILETVASQLSQGIDPNRNESSGLAGDVIVDIPSGATGTYDQMRVQRRSSNPHPLEARLQGLTFLPKHFRRINFDGGLESLALPSRLTFYVDDQDDDGVVDGEAMKKSSLKVFRFNPLLKVWQPLGEQIVQPQEDLVRASLLAVGDVGIAGESDGRAPADTASDCGLLGLEALLLLALLRRLRR